MVWSCGPEVLGTASVTPPLLTRRVQILLPRPRVCDEHLLVTTFHRAAPLGSRFERGPQVISGAGGSLARFYTSDHRLRCATPRRLNGESEHLTQLRAAIGRTWPVSVRSVRSCRIFGRLSALRIRMTIAYSPNPRHNNRSNHPRPRPNERTSEADGRSAIGDLRATNDERRSPTGARGLPGAAPACGLWFYFIFGFG